MSQLDRHARHQMDNHWQQLQQTQRLQHGEGAAVAAAKSALDALIRLPALGHVATPSPLPHISSLPGADDKEWDSCPPLAACDKQVAHSEQGLAVLSSPTAGLTSVDGEGSLKSSTPLSPPATSKSLYRRLSLQSLPTGRTGAQRRAPASAAAAMASVRSAPTPSPSPAIQVAPRGLHSPASQLEQYQQQQHQPPLSLPTPIDVANNSPSQQMALSSSSSSCGVLSAGGPLSVGSGLLDSTTSSCCSNYSNSRHAPMSLLSLDYLSPSSSPPPTGCSSSSSVFAASQSATSRSACMSRSSVGSSCLFSPPGLNERASLTEELSSDGADSSSSPDRSRRSRSATTHSTSIAHSAASNCAPSPAPAPLSLSLMRPGVLMGVPKSQISTIRAKRRQHMQQSQLSAALSALAASVAPCYRLSALSLMNDGADLDLGVVAAPLYPTPSPRSGCSDSTMSPSPRSDSALHHSFLTPYPSPVAESQDDELDDADITVPASANTLTAEPATTAAPLTEDERQLRFLHEIAAPVAFGAGISISLISPPAAGLNVGAESLLLTDSTVPRRTSPAPLQVVSPPPATGSPIGVEMSEEQQKHIASLVRKSRKRSTRRRSSGSKLFTDASLSMGTTPPMTHRHNLPSARGVDVPSAAHTCSGSQPTPSSANCCSTHSTPGSRGTALLTAPFSSPASNVSSLKSPMLSPSLTFLSSSPRNFNKFNLKLPSGSPPLLALSHRTSDGASSTACGATPYSSEDDFGATPDNAGLGTEEDGEIILCGIHVQGASSHSDAASTGSDTSESDSDATPSAASTLTSMLALLPAQEAVGAAGAEDAVTTPSVVPSAVLSFPSTPHCLPSDASLVPAFSSAFDTSHIDRMDGHTLRASAAQEASESSVNNTPPMRPQPTDESRPDPPVHQLPSPRAAAFRRRMARRATIANADYSPVSTDSNKSNSRHSKSRSSVPYDFSPAGHLIIDGFEISKKGVARTPEVASRRLTSISCGSSPMLAPRSLLNLRRDSSPGSAGGSDPVPPLQLPRKLSALSTTISDPSSLSNTPTLLGRRLSLVQQQREKEAIMANSHSIACGSAARSLFQRRRWGSADVTPLMTLPHFVTADSAPSSARCLPDMVSGGDALTDQALKNSFGPKFKQPKAASLGIEMRLSDLVRFGEIGRGANGAVHKAVHLPTLRVVALKSVSIFDAECSHQFLQELHAFLHCDSEQMVKFIGACFSEGMITMALEYLNRGSLDHVVQQSGPLSESALKLVVQQLLMGIRDLHANSFLHRDIKPANCLINNWGVAKISDFGLLKRLVANESGTMECNRFVGTMLYLAPERIAGQSFSFPSDIYAAGLTVIYLATGALQQVPKDYWALVQGANNANAPPPSLPSDADNAARFSDNLRDFVSHMVAKDPAARWTAAQLLEHPWFQEEAAASEGAAVDPLEQWPGRQLTEPQPEELSILMDAVIQRWYPMPTVEPEQPVADFEPSAFDLTRFTHLAQQLGWDEKAVVAAFVERIQQKTAAALEQLRSSAASSTQVDSSMTDYSSNSSAEPSSVCRHSFSSTDSSSLSTASNSFSHLSHGSLLEPATVEPATVESDTVADLPPPNLPLHSGSPRGLAAAGPRWSGTSSLLLSRSLNTSPCNSPTNANKPPKAPVRPRSPSPAAEPLVCTAGGSMDASAMERSASRRLSACASGRRLSFSTRRADMSPFATQSASGPGPSSHTSSCNSSHAASIVHSPALAPPRALGFNPPGESIGSPVTVLPPLHNRAQTDADPFPCHNPATRPRCSM